MLFVHSILLSTQENSTEGTDKPLLRGGGTLFYAMARTGPMEIRKTKMIIYQHCSIDLWFISSITYYFVNRKKRKHHQRRLNSFRFKPSQNEFKLHYK